MAHILFRPRRIVTLLAAAVLLAAAYLVGVAPTLSPAHALCSTPTMTGNWHNTNASTRSMTRVVVGFHCGDQVLCDVNGHCSGGSSYYTLHPYGKCHPTDCDWGTRQAATMTGGWQRAIFPSSYATRYVWTKTYVFSGRTYLRVYVRTDFTPADGRPDYNTDEWMLK